MITLLIACGAIAALAILFSDLGWNNVLSPDRNELVFDGRHRGYGAYVLRREHHRSVLVAFLLTLGLLGAGVGAPRLFNHGPSESPVAPPPIDTIYVELLPPERVEAIQERRETSPQDRSHPEDLIPVAIDSAHNLAPLDTMDHGTNPAPGGGGTRTTPIDTLPSGGGGGGGSTPPPGPVSFAEIMPEFPEGDAGLQRFWSNKVDFEPWMLLGEKKAVVYVEFVIDMNGKVADARIARGFAPDLDRAVMNAVHRMPDWSPGKQGDHNVAVRFTQPVRFTVRN